MSEKNMIKGFNDGYLLQQHRPELANALEEGLKEKNGAYAKGFSQGRNEYQKSQTIEKSNSYQDYLKSKGLSANRSQSKEQSKSKDQNRDKDMSL